MSFGERLRELRIAVGKSQDEVANEIADLFPGQIRISQTSLSALEQRETAPRQHVLDILAQYYDVPITYFFESRMDAEEEDVRRAMDYLQNLKQSLQKREFTGDMLYAHSTEPRYDSEDEIGEGLKRYSRQQNSDCNEE